MGSLLVSPTNVPAGYIPKSPPLITTDCNIAQPINPVDDNEFREPLVTITHLPHWDAFNHLSVLTARAMVLRETVVAKLDNIQQKIPYPFGIVVLDAWRSLAEQDVIGERDSVDECVHPCMATNKYNGERPAHTTGGAVDITLTYNGTPLALGTDYGECSSMASLSAYEDATTDEDVKIRDLRRFLGSRLTEEDMAPYAPLWWHWSFGDDVWAHARAKLPKYDIYEYELF